MLQVPAKMGSYNFGTWQGPVAVMVIPLDEELRHDKNIYRDHVRADPENLIRQSQILLFFFSEHFRRSDHALDYDFRDHCG